MCPISAEFKHFRGRNPAFAMAAQGLVNHAGRGLVNHEARSCSGDGGLTRLFKQKRKELA
jgi:hypothetical protein